MDRTYIADQPYKIFQVLKGYAGKRQEHFGIILLDSGLRIIKRKVLFIGTESRTMIERKVVFWEACSGKASAVVLFHNHPTGNLQPSGEDIKTTEDLAEGFASLGIQILDHIIVGRTWQDSFFSFKEHGLLKPEENKLDKVAEVQGGQK